jgi:S-(hydroxymethyl)glutathione dehydrogenase/alcohol dehydrogenase
MRAGVVVSTGEFAIEEISMKEPGPHDVVVRMEASGVCHSDISVLNGLAGMGPPLVLGHEGAGSVEWVGSDVSRVRVGDRVIASLGAVCGTCWYCRREQTQLCEEGASVAADHWAVRADGSQLPTLAGLGTFAEAMTVHEWSIVPVQTDLPAEQLALIGCGVTTGLGAVLNTGRPQVGDTVGVIGLGGVGMAAIQGARIAGASRVIAIDPVEAKRTAALGFGATDVIDPAAGDVVKQVRAITGRRGVDVAIEAVGASALIEQASKMTRRGGTTVLVGAAPFDATVTYKPGSFLIEDRDVRASYYGRTQALRDFPRYLSLIEAGRLDVSGMVSERISLDELPAVLLKEPGDAIRHVVV